MCAPDYHKGRAAEEHTRDPGCTSIWDCAGRCAPLLQGGTYSPRKKIVKELSYFHNKLKDCRKNFSSLPESELECRELRVCLSGVIRVQLARVRIHLWWVSKQRKGQLMTQQTTLAWLTCILHLLVSVTLAGMCLCLPLPMWIDAFQQYRWLPCISLPAPVAY